MLTSTVMIRRMKVDILKNLPTKVREKAYINIEDDDLKNEFRTYMVRANKPNSHLLFVSTHPQCSCPAAQFSSKFCVKERAS